MQHTKLCPKNIILSEINNHIVNSYFTVFYVTTIRKSIYRIRKNEKLSFFKSEIYD